MPAQRQHLLFEPADPVRLGVLRIVMSLQAIAALFGVPFMVIRAVPGGLALVPIELAEPVAWSRFLFGATPPSDGVVNAMWWLVLAAFLLLLVGYRTRIVSPLCAVLALVYFGLDFSFGKIPALTSLWMIALMCACWSPWGDALSMDAHLGAPVRSRQLHGAFMRLLLLELGIVYLGSAISKLRGGSLWLTRDGLWRHFVDSFYLDGRADLVVASLPVTWQRRFMVAHPAICRVFQLGTLGLEGTFLTAFFVPRLRPLYLLGGVGFHLGIWFTFGDLTPMTLVPFYVVWLPWERWLKRGG